VASRSSATLAGYEKQRSNELNRKLLLCVVAVVPFLAGCSTREDFVVINKSAQVVDLRYRMKGCGGEVSSNELDRRAPAKLALKEFQQSDRVWVSLSKADYHYDGRTCTYYVRVAPDEALLVDYAYNYGDPNSERSDLYFDLEELSIAGARGDVVLQGRQTQAQFKLESGAYIIRYE
jgi:hypothetical protein